MPDEGGSFLEKRTEGWVVGLQLANSLIIKRGEAASVIRSISGTERHIADYLMEEVLAGLPEDILIFPIKTFFPKRFAAPRVIIFLTYATLLRLLPCWRRQNFLSWSLIFRDHGIAIINCSLNLSSSIRCP